MISNIKNKVEPWPIDYCDIYATPMIYSKAKA